MDSSFLKTTIIIFAIGIVCSCGTTAYSTKYRNDAIIIGMTKDELVLKYGNPYSENLYVEDGKISEVLCYKELMSYGYYLFTKFYFADDRLVKKEQIDINPYEAVLKYRKSN